MRLIKFLSVFAVAGVMLASCASVAHVEKDEDANFAAYRSYAWVDSKDNQEDSGKTKVSDLTERKIREAVSAELAKTGWKETKNKPDVLISYDVLVERGIVERNNPVYSQPTTRYVFNPYSRRWVSIYYPSQFMGYDNDQRTVREGTITVSIIDSKTDKTIWQGWTTEEINSRNLTTKEIQNSVKSIFRKFDVASR